MGCPDTSFASHQRADVVSLHHLASQLASALELPGLLSPTCCSDGGAKTAAVSRPRLSVGTCFLIRALLLAVLVVLSHKLSVNRGLLSTSPMDDTSHFFEAASCFQKMSCQADQSEGTRSILGIQRLAWTSTPSLVDRTNGFPWVSCLMLGAA